MTAPIDPIPVTTPTVTTGGQTMSRTQLLGRLRGSFGATQAVQTSTINTPQVTSAVSQLDALDVLEQKIAEAATVVPVEQPPLPQQEPVLTPQTDVDQLGAIASAMPQAVNATSDTLNRNYAPTRAKEVIEAKPSNVQPAEAGHSGVVEVEPPRELELPVEVESFIQKVEQNDQLPQEIVVAANGNDINLQAYAKQPVIVLPITPDEEKDGMKKDPTSSFRWLVEWSRKVMKLFSGMVIYREKSE